MIIQIIGWIIGSIITFIIITLLHQREEKQKNRTSKLYPKGVNTYE